MAPPIVRMLAFMPLATPVCDIADRLHDQVGHRGEGEPERQADDDGDDEHLPDLARARGEAEQGERVQAGAEHEHAAWSRAGPRAARRRCRPAKVAADCGSIIRPDSVTEAPKPYPVTSGVCRNCGRKANSEYIPTPNSRATRLVVQTAGMRIIRMSMSGASLRTSTVTQPAHSTTDPTNSPTMVTDVQPHTLPWLTASSRQTSQPDSSRAARTSIRPGVRTGDSGTNTAVATAAQMVRTMGSQNSQW